MFSFCCNKIIIFSYSTMVYKSINLHPLVYLLLQEHKPTSSCLLFFFLRGEINNKNACFIWIRIVAVILTLSILIFTLYNSSFLMSWMLFKKLLQITCLFVYLLLGSSILCVENRWRGDASKLRCLPWAHLYLSPVYEKCLCSWDGMGHAHPKEARNIDYQQTQVDTSSLTILNDNVSYVVWLSFWLQGIIQTYS